MARVVESIFGSVRCNHTKRRWLQYFTFSHRIYDLPFRNAQSVRQTRHVRHDRSEMILDGFVFDEVKIAEWKLWIVRQLVFQNWCWLQFEWRFKRISLFNRCRVQVVSYELIVVLFECEWNAFWLELTENVFEIVLIDWRYTVEITQFPW